jgi:general secretion pathway protein J
VIAGELRMKNLELRIDDRTVLHSAFYIRNSKLWMRGFTLVEILVASTIGAFVALVAVGALRAVTASSEMVDSGIATAAEVRFASNMVARDLVNLYRDKTKANTKLIGTVVQSGQGDTSYLILYTVSRVKARAGRPEGDIYEVEYYLANTDEHGLEHGRTRTGMRLMRRFWPNPNQEAEPGGILSVIAEGVDVFEVRYFDGEEWSNEWSEDMQTLPQLIEVNIAAGQAGSGRPIMESFIVNFARPAAGGTLTVGSEGESGVGSSTESGAANSGASGTGSSSTGAVSR